MYPRTLCLVALAVLAGCATPYKSFGVGGGFSESWSNDTHFAVLFRGNEYTSAEHAGNYALLRACQIAIERGSPLLAVMGYDAARSTTSTQVGSEVDVYRPDGVGSAAYVGTHPARYYNSTTGLAEVHGVLLTERGSQFYREADILVIDPREYVRQNAPSGLREQILGTSS